MKEDLKETGDFIATEFRATVFAIIGIIWNFMAFQAITTDRLVVAGGMVLACYGVIAWQYLDLRKKYFAYREVNNLGDDLLASLNKFYGLIAVFYTVIVCAAVTAVLV